MAQCDTRGVLLDFIAAGEATIVSWELITIFHQYGEPLWILAAYTAMVVKLYKYKWEVTACPYSHVLSLLRGVISYRHAAARILAQFLGGSVFYRHTDYRHSDLKTAIPLFMNMSLIAVHCF